MRRLSPLVLILLLATSVWAEPTQHNIEFAGRNFQPEVHQINGRTMYDTHDQEVLSLISIANVTAQWSTSGHTMFAFAPGRESYWTVGSDEARVNGREIPAPGLLLIEGEKRYIEPSALFFALATKGVESEEGYTLYPVITGIGQSETGYLLKSASKAKPVALKSEQGSVFSIDGFAWDGDNNEIAMGEANFLFSGGADKGEPLTVTVTTRPFTAATLGGSTLLNETKIDLLPNFPGAEYSAEVNLEAVKAEENKGNGMLTFSFDRGARMHYLYDEEKQEVRVFIPKANYTGTEFVSEEWPGVEIGQYQTALYPVLEVVIPTNGEKLEFVNVEGANATLALLKGSEDTVETLAASGSVETLGWMNAGGTIVIDPGHGGSDPGCINRALGTREADVTLKIAKHLAEILRAQGWNVVLTRETDRDVTYAGSPDRMELEARSGIANRLKADLFMSIHCNASVGSQHYGSSIHWWKAEDYEFARSLEPVLGNAIGLGQKGLIRNRFVVLRHAEMPSVLVETAFLTNPREGAMLSDPEFQKTIARQLAGGLASYMRGTYASRGGRPVD